MKRASPERDENVQPKAVMPAHADFQVAGVGARGGVWIPAFAGMTTAMGGRGVIQGIFEAGFFVGAIFNRRLVVLITT
jgi:hypothetical protein